MNYKVQLEHEVNTQNQWKKPQLFKIIMHNDEITTMDFVVLILLKIFNKNKIDSTNIMLKVHNDGSAVVGVYTYDIAITKKMQTDQMSNEKGFPLRVTVEEATD